MKTRKDLPRLGYLKEPTVDVGAIISHLRDNDLLNPEFYNDIKVSANSKHKDFVIANEYCKDSFFKEDGAAMMEGESYKQLYLTDFDESKVSGNVKLEYTNIFQRTKRLDPKQKNYLAEADELNYGIKNHLVKGVLENTLNLFKDKITRVRLAYLKDHSVIKPHVDYDPSYITRFHIPLITHQHCRIFVERNGDILETHLPADGKIYFLNSGLKHSVMNDGDNWRLHLIVDVHGQTALDNLVTLYF